MFKNQKALQIAIVVVLATGIILAGTFAWINFTQQATNIFTGWTNPDVNLHDDYEQGEANKDVYVENSGQRPLYVRVRFDEFMKIDQRVLINGTSETNKDTWHSHSYLGTAPESCGKEPHEYYEWILGSSASDPQQGMKLFVPAPASKRATFDTSGVETKAPQVIEYNQAELIYGASSTNYDTNLVTLKATYERIDALLNANSGAARATLTSLYAALDAASTTAARTAANTAITNFLTSHELGYYDKDTATSVVKFVPIERTLKTTKVYTMAQWIAAGTPQGNFWIMDTDGWCYWGNILLPNQATGLLLSEVNLNEQNPPAGVWYYAINAKLEAVTYDDLNEFSATGDGRITDQGSMVLMAVSGNYVFDMQSTAIGPNDPVYTFVNNKDNTYRMMITNGSNVTFGPLFVYTGTVPPAAKGAIYKTTEYIANSQFKKDIPFGLNGETFTVKDIVEGLDGKHYIKVTYGTPAKTAYLAPGANGKFDVLAPGTPKISNLDDVLVWTDGTIPGDATKDRYQEVDTKKNVQVGDVFTVNGTTWEVIGLDASSATDIKALIITKNVVATADNTASASSLITFAESASNTTLNAFASPTSLTLNEAMNYFSNNAARVTTGAGSTAQSQWWLKDGIVGTNGALLPASATGTVGIRPAMWVKTADIKQYARP